MMRPEIVLGCAALMLGIVSVKPLDSPPAKVPVPTSSQPAHAVLVELFTSEGCSSCPPADALLRSINGTRTKAGTLIIGVSEHVNYWDHGGWVDPFDSPEITARQNDYADRFHLDSVYTPQMVVNGEIQVSGNDPRALDKAVQAAESQHDANVKILSAAIEGRTLVATISISGEISKHGADMYAVVAEDETTTHVAGGENKGRTLINASVARNLLRTGTIREGGETTIRIPLPKDSPTTPGSRRHLITWVQERNLGTVLGVDTRAF